MSSTGRVSPTAHYTGYVWARNGLSDPELETVEGRVLFETLRVPMTVSALLGGGTLEAYLLTRHRAIDALLQRAIDEGRVTQVVEVAAGLSPRGLRFTRRYGDRLTYVEADLPEMVTRKRAALERIGSLSDRHRVEEVDALRDQGPASLGELAGCSATWRRTTCAASGAGSPRPLAASSTGRISRTSTWASSRTFRSGRFGCSYRCSSAAASTFTSERRTRSWER